MRFFAYFSLDAPTRLFLPQYRFLYLARFDNQLKGDIRLQQTSKIFSNVRLVKHPPALDEHTMFPRMALPNLAFFRDDFRMTTWLLTGAALQCLVFLTLPTYVAILPTLFLVSTRIVTFILIRCNFIPDPSFDKVKLGRLTAQIPHGDGTAPEKPAEKGIVVLVLGARSNQFVSRHSVIRYPN